MSRFYNIFVYLLVLVLLQACAGTGVAPVANRGEVKDSAPTTTQRSTKPQPKTAPKSTSKDKSGYHIVTKGDTLYSIAWRYDFDYKDIASWNQVNAPYTIYPGQFIRLKPIPKKKGAPLKSEPIAKKTPAKVPLEKTLKPVQKKTVVAAKKPESKLKSESKPDLPKGPVKWSWPTNGKIVKSKSPTSKKGIDISGSPGQTIKAAAGGEVVYSGSGLIGYGKLIIIKHNETYLSAYAYNSKLLVKEGDRVTAGQHISEMGRDHTGHNVLHFEIRQNGKPVSPIKHLPKKRV